MFPLNTNSAPVPKNKMPKPRLINASQRSIEIVAIIPAKNFEVTIWILDTGRVISIL